MSTTEPPTSQLPPDEPPKGSGEGSSRRSWGSRLRSRGVVVTAVVAALVVIGGVTAALLLPGRDHDHHGPGGPGFGRAGWSEDGGPWMHHRGGPFERGSRDSDGDFEDFDEGPGFGPGPGPGRGFGDEPVLTGTVASVAQGSIVVNVDGAGPRTLRTDDDTEVGGASNGGLGDLQVGERVVVRVEGSGDTASAERIWVPLASVTGTVVALSGDTATVTSVAGLPVSVDVTALSQKPVVGDVVVLTGTADGTTIRADGIRVLPKAG